MTHFLGTPAMLALDILFITYTLWAVSLGRALTPTTRWLGFALFAWLAILHLGLSESMLFPASVSGGAFYLIILGGVAAVGLFMFAIPPLRRLFLGLDQRQLLLLHGVRVYFGALFLAQAGVGLLPQAFGLIDGLTHVSAGFFALVAAFSTAAGVNSRRRAWFANAFGLVDILVVATSLAFVLLDEIGPHHPMMYAVFLPAPFWLWFHVLSIAKLISEHSNPAVTAKRPAARI